MSKSIQVRGLDEMDELGANPPPRDRAEALEAVAAAARNMSEVHHRTTATHRDDEVAMEKLDKALAHLSRVPA